MNLSVLADILQVVYGAALILLLIMAIGAWRSKQEVSATQLARDFEGCKKACETRHAEFNARLLSYARNDVVTVELRAINQRLTTIERAVLHEHVAGEGGD